MKRLFLILILIGSFAGLAQNIVNNPANPPAKNAGRVVGMKEVLRITEDSQDFFFIFPHHLKVDAQGNIFVVDKEQFLKFSKTGKFERNMYKSGQGPGEFTHFLEYMICRDHIIMFNLYPDKIVRLDKSGNLIGEKRIHIKGTLRFVFSSGDQYCFRVQTIREFKKELSVIDADNSFVLTSLDGKISKENLHPFTSKIFAFRSESGGAALLDMSDFKMCENDTSSFYFSTSPRYEIHLFDMNRAGVTLTVKRDYERVKVKKEYEEYLKRGRIGDGVRMYSNPIPEYFNDIIKFVKHKDNLWVITSTVDEKKGILVDVFAKNGKYINNFYLNLPKNIIPYSLIKYSMTISGDFIYLVEKDEDDVFSIAKYKIIDQ